MHIKRTLAVFGLTALGAVGAESAAAQGLGLNGGLSISDLFGDAVQSSSARTGLTAGGAVTLVRFGPVSVGPEFYYAQKGASEATLLLDDPESFAQFGLNYLEVPLLAQVRIPIHHRYLRGYLQGGPVFAWNLDCNLERSADDTLALNDECAIDQFQDGRAAVKSADQGLVIGGGLRVNVFDIGSVNIDARFIRGLARLTEGARELDLGNQAVALMLGYSFGW